MQDLGFLSFTLPEVEILMPTKKPRGGELSREQDLANQALHQRRLRIEHVNSSVKRCRIVKDGFWGATEQETGVSQRFPSQNSYFLRTKAASGGMGSYSFAKVSCKRQNLCDNFCKGVDVNY